MKEELREVQTNTALERQARKQAIHTLTIDNNIATTSFTQDTERVAQQPRFQKILTGECSTVGSRLILERLRNRKQTTRICREKN